MDWISIDIERPRIAQWVLCLCSKGSNWLAFRTTGGWYINTNHGQVFISKDDKKEDGKYIEIKYWIQIPHLPKELMLKLFPETEKCGSDSCPDDGRCEHCQKPT